MLSPYSSPHLAAANSFTTDVAAHLLGVLPGTMRKAHCLRGEYMGLRPLRLPNRRLLWPKDELLQLISHPISGAAA